MLLGSRQTVSSELTPREFHPNCRSDRAALIACDVFFTLGLWLDGSTIVIPTVIAIPGATRYSQRGFSLGPVNLNRGAWRSLLLWLVLSRIGTDVLDEWVFGFQGAWRGGWPSHTPTTTFKARKRTYFFENFEKIFYRPKQGAKNRASSWYPVAKITVFNYRVHRCCSFSRSNSFSIEKSRMRSFLDCREIRKINQISSLFSCKDTFHSDTTPIPKMWPSPLYTSLIASIMV